MVDEVEEPRVGMMEVFEDHDDGLGHREPLEEGPPRPEQLVGRAAGLETEQGQESGFDP